MIAVTTFLVSPQMSRHIVLLGAVGLGSYLTGTLIERRKYSSNTDNLEVS